MKKIYFIFGVHNHQPVGNFPEIFEKAYQEAYSPFVETMLRHPKIKWSLHCSGILWDFIFAKHPEYVKTISNMVSAGQVELLTGGYYEPIMPVIPDSDKKGQIHRLTSFIEKKFKYKSKGMWLAERVWEPHMAKILSEAGVEYTIVDDAHFSFAGLDVEKLRGYYVTEEQGVKLNIFPISQRLRYYIPFQNVEKTIDYMSECARENACPVLVMADDGEKFGLWPETYKHVYHDRWLENFLTAIEKNMDWIKPLTFYEYMKKFPPEGRVYLPTASYFEMSEWALPQASQEEFETVVKHSDSMPVVKRFLRGGFWRNFLTKYEESNNMHKKMLYVSNKINVMLDAKDKKSRKDNREQAFDSLYSGQCNCAYWHGVFGGLYLPHLRSAVYQKLLEAENIFAQMIGQKPKWNEYDFDCDGRNELIFEDKHQNLYFAPHRGGALFEWDILSKKVNLLNVLTRRSESYHKRLKEFLANPQKSNSEIKTIHDIVKVKEQNLDDYLQYDWYRRSSLIDHFLHPNTKFEDFRKVQYGEQGDFVLGDYHSKVAGEKLVLFREGRVWDNNSQIRMSVEKSISPKDAGIKVSYKVGNLENREASVLFAPEFNYAFSYPLKEESSFLKAVKVWSRKDDIFGFALDMKFSTQAELWTFPLETVSLSEAGFERTYQGTVVVPLYKLNIPANAYADFEIEIQLND